MKRWFHVCPKCHATAQNAENKPYFRSQGNRTTAFGKCQWCGHTSSTKRFKLERVINAAH